MGWFSSRSATGGEDQAIELHFFEKFVAPVVQTISTVTFFKGDSPAAFLSERVASILSANPWLAGTLNKSFGKLDLLVPSTIDVQRHFSEVDMPDLLYDIDPAKLTPMLRQFAVVNGIHKKPLFMVTLLHAASNTFAVIVSIHHAIADGHTFYQIYGMLSSNGIVKPLDAKRDPSYSEAKLDSIFGKEKRRGLLSISATLGRLFSFYSSSPVVGVYLVKQEWLAQQKQEFHSSNPQDARVPFVSTNDILTSWFLRTGNFLAGLMAVNLRNRVPSFTDEKAGNYEFIIHYFPEQFATPAGIRKGLTAKDGLRTSRTDFNSIAQQLTSAPGLVTNWVSFYQDLALPKCEQIFHFPMGEADWLTLPIMCIFRPTKERLGVLVIARTQKELDKYISSDALKSWIV